MTLGAICIVSSPCAAQGHYHVIAPVTLHVIHIKYAIVAIMWNGRFVFRVHRMKDRMNDGMNDRMNDKMA